MNEILMGLLMVAAGIILLALFLLPTAIAFKRAHHYKWVICAINILCGITGVGYLIALAWALWPSRTGLIDVLVNDPTTNSADANNSIYSRYGENLKALNVARTGISVFVQRGEQRLGPYSIEEARLYVESGQYSLTDLAWCEGCSGWIPLSEIFLKFGSR